MGWGSQTPALAPGHPRGGPGQALGISGEGGPQLGVGEGRQEREGFLRTGLEEEDTLAGLPKPEAWLSTLPAQEIASLPQGTRMGWSCLLGLPLLLPHSRQESGVKNGADWAVPQPSVTWLPGPGWASRSAESWELGPRPHSLCAWRFEDAR